MFPDLNLPADQQGTGRAAEVGGTSRQKVVYEPTLIWYPPDPHVELQAGGFSFFPDWLMDFFTEEVSFPPPQKPRKGCYEVFMSSVHDELRK
jgi:hypothetical protein